MARLPEGDLATRQIFDIIRSYTTALDLLDDYDNQTIGRPQGTEGSYVLDYDECRGVIAVRGVMATMISSHPCARKDYMPSRTGEEGRLSTAQAMNAF